jgi:cell wall-associated NlpC family hydrolase
MNYFFPISFLLFFTGCIFQPPPKTVDDKIDIYQERELSPDVTTQSTEDILLTKNSEKLLSLAYAQIGTPYLYGGDSLGGFDCSGFVSYVYRYAIGKNLPRTSRAQAEFTNRISRHQLIPGDIVFFDTSKKGHINHCGIYFGNGRFIHASSGKVYAVTISDLDRGFYKDKFRWGGRVVE